MSISDQATLNELELQQGRWHKTMDGCRIQLKTYTVAKGSVSAVFRDGNVEVLLDGCNETMIVPPDCIMADDAEGSVHLAVMYLRRGFSAAGMNFIERICAEHAYGVVAMLKIADFLVDFNELREAERVLREALRLDPSVTSANHLRALCGLAEVKRRLGYDNEAICLCEKVLLHEFGPGHESSARALTCLCQVYHSLGDISEVVRLRSKLQCIEELRTEACMVKHHSMATGHCTLAMTD
jgi:hypothetical protein